MQSRVWSLAQFDQSTFCLDRSFDAFDLSIFCPIWSIELLSATTSDSSIDWSNSPELQSSWFSIRSAPLDSIEPLALPFNRSSLLHSSLFQFATAPRCPHRLRTTSQTPTSGAPTSFNIYPNSDFIPNHHLCCNA